MSCVKSDTFPIGRNNPNHPFLNKVNPYTWQQFYIPIQVQAADGTWKQFRAQVDTGADVTTLTKQAAELLGFKPAMGKANSIFGADKTSISVITMKANIKIGKLAPMNTEINFSPEIQLTNNLLGNKDLISSGRFEWRFTSSSLTVYDKQAKCPVPAAKAKAALAHVLYDVDDVAMDYYFNY